MKKVRICLGRFQPFTLGHLKMATYKCKGPETISGFKGPVNQKELLREQPDIKEINKQKTLILVVKVDDNEVDKRHPFSCSLMKEEMNLVKSYSEIEDVMFVDSADICAWGEMIKKAGYQASVWITGSDEAKPYVEMAMKVPEYEEHNRDNRDCKDAYTKSFYVESIERTDDGDFESSISGTKVREAILNDDKELFSKMMPKGCDKLYNKFKEALSNPNLPDKYTKPKKKKIKEYLNIKMKNIDNYINEGRLDYLNKSVTPWEQSCCGDGLALYYAYIKKHGEHVGDGDYSLEQIEKCYDHISSNPKGAIDKHAETYEKYIK